jgi:diaminopimelate epimerase
MSEPRSSPALRFVKAHAYGNDFLYVRRELVDGVDLKALAIEMCDRHTGIGADGLILFEPLPTAVSMRLFNSDGSDAEVSGNGVRGLGALVLANQPRADAEVTIDTAAGSKRLSRLARDGHRQTFRSAMGLPAGVRQVSIDSDLGSIDAVVLNFGNPQCVILGPLPAPDRFTALGAMLERHPMFPDRTNVEFAEVESPDRVRILIWERGCGPTTSSGTGSCGALVAAASFGGAMRDAEVMAPGGPQRVEWLADSVYLTGWAELICEGDWLRELPELAAVAAG